MASCDAQTLAANAKCLNEQIPQGMRLPVLIYLASLLAKVDPGDVQSLIDNAKCIECGLSQGLQLPALISLSGQMAAETTPVISLDSVNSTHSSIILTISNASPPLTYEVWKSTDAGVTFSLVATIPGTSTTYNDMAGMTSGNMWSYKFRSTGRTDFSNVIGPLVYLQFGGAVLVTINQSAPIIQYAAYPATVNDDGSAPYNGGSGHYTAPIAGSRGAVLNTAVVAFNSTSGIQNGHDLFISSGHFDVGGDWVLNPRYWWANCTTFLVTGVGIHGQGMNSTFIQITTPTSSWGPFFNGILFGNQTVLTDFSLNQYFDGPDEHVGAGTTNGFVWMKNVRHDTTRCRTGGLVVKGGIIAGGTPTASGQVVLNAGNGSFDYGANLIGCEFYCGGISIDQRTNSFPSVNAYNTSFFRRWTNAIQDLRVQDPNVAGGNGIVAVLNLYRCIIDGGMLPSIGIDAENDSTNTYCYDATLFQNRLATAGNYNFYDNSNSGISNHVSPSIVVGNATPAPQVVAEPSYTVPSLPTPTTIPYNSPVFLT